MRKGLKRASVIATGLCLFSLLAFPLWAATPEAVEAYKEYGQEVMTEEGQIESEDRPFLNDYREELELTQQEATQIEEQVRQALRRKR